jgi:hypothetical protein
VPFGLFPYHKCPVVFFPIIVPCGLFPYHCALWSFFLSLCPLVFFPIEHIYSEVTWTKHIYNFLGLNQMELSIWYANQRIRVKPLFPGNPLSVVI